MMADMNDFPFNSEGEHELKLGSGFNLTGKAESAFHTIRYDFKPASVDTTKPAELTVGPKDEIKVTVPHVQDSGATLYKGSKRSCPKECLLIIDKSTGTFTLERIASTVPQLKKIRSAVSQPKGAKVSSSLNVPAVPSVPTSSPANTPVPTSFPANTPATSSKQSPVTKPALPQPTIKNLGSMLSTDTDSSSDDSSSSDSENDDNDDDDEDDDEVNDKDVEQLNSFLTSDKEPPGPGYNQLCEDLHLSESGSDSD